MNEPKKRKTARICFIQPVQSPYWTERLKELAKYKELEIILLLERDSFTHRPGWKPELIDGITTIILGSKIRSIRNKHNDLGYQIDGVRAVSWRLSNMLSELMPDVVVACNATQILFSQPARLRHDFHLALIVEDTPHSTRNLSWYKLLVKKSLYRLADSWLPFTEDAEIFLKNIGINKNLHRSCWSINTEIFTPIFNAHSDGEIYTICVIAGLIELKGIMQLLEEWNSIAVETRKKFQLKIAGSGPLRNKIEQYLLTNNLQDVTLLGQIPYAEVIKLLQHSRLSVLPTLQDVYGMVVPEAMACACPVITTPFAGARDLVQHGFNGWIADPTKPGDLAYWLTLAMNDIDHLEKMGINARESALRRDNKIVMQQFAKQLIAMSSYR